MDHGGSHRNHGDHRPWDCSAVSMVCTRKSTHLVMALFYVKTAATVSLTTTHVNTDTGRTSLKQCAVVAVVKSLITASLTAPCAPLSLDAMRGWSIKHQTFARQRRTLQQ